MKRWFTLSSAALALFAALIVAQNGRAQGGGAEVAGAIIGTWNVHIVPPAASGVPAYDSLSTHAAGGVLIVSPDPSFGPSLHTSTGHGAWKQIGPSRNFATTHGGFVYDPGGSVVFTFKINSSIVVDGDTFQGQGQLVICDANFDGCSPASPGLAQLTGRRLGVTKISTE